MASIGDYIFLIICLSLLGAIIYGVKNGGVNDSLQAQREAMKSKGIHLSSEGLSVKTNRVALTREDEVTKAQSSLNKSGDVLRKHKDAFKFQAGTGYEAPDLPTGSKQGKRA